MTVNMKPFDSSEIHLDFEEWKRKCSEFSLWRSQCTPRKAYDRFGRLCGEWNKNAGEGWIRVYLNQ